MGIEFELKFRATPDTLASLQKRIPGSQQVYAMETTYYDTPTGALSARYYTLRRRMENDTSVCTLKTPASGEGRNEFEVECHSIEAAIPMLCELSGEDIPLPVVPVCGAKFTRIAKTLELNQCTVEIALDQGILMGGGKEIPLCEVEVELKDGSPDAARAYAVQLALAFGMEPETKSKFRRAKDLCDK
ncbi:MAG: CYTH domain-containing protein [Oscillospiraceae bacterium]|nr:CYTH domain-containing protein [Oscillospiraceae bacterium]